MGEVGFEPTQQTRHEIYSLARLSHVGAPPPCSEFRATEPFLITGIDIMNLEL